MTAQVLDSMDLEKRARHHDQGPRGPARVHGRRRPGLRPEPDRHARPRRLQLRGQPQPAGVRGRDPRGRRHAGHRGADPREHPPGAQAEPGDHPGPQQDRPAVRPGGRRSSRSWRACWRSRARRSCSRRPRTGPACRRSSRRSSSGCRRPRATRRKPLQGLIFDSHYDAYKGVVVYIRLAQGTMRTGDNIRLMGSGAEAELLEVGYFKPQLVPVPEMHAGDVGYVATGPQERPRCPGRRHGHARCRSRARAAARLPAGEDPRLRGHLPDHRLGVSEPPRGDGEAPPQRRELQLRARKLGGPRVRLPLRFPGPAAHGDHPGAPGARVRPGADRLGALGRVPGRAAEQRREPSPWTTRPRCRTRASSRRSWSRG